MSFHRIRKTFGFLAVAVEEQDSRGVSPVVADNGMNTRECLSIIRVERAFERTGGDGHRREHVDVVGDIPQINL